MRPVSGHPPFATGYRRPCSDRRRCGVAKAGRSTSRHTRCDGAAHSARHQQMPLRTEPLDRPALSSSSRDFQFLVRDARPSGTLLPDAWHNRKVNVGQQIPAELFSPTPRQTLGTVESVVRWCARYCRQHRARYISYKNQPARCDQATARWKFPRFQQLERETSLDAGGL